MIETLTAAAKPAEATPLSENRVIRVEGLVKRFGDFTAVDNISFDVREGEIFGFLGPNGAGKSTTIKVMSTLLQPTSGRVEVAGQDVTKNPDDVRAALGIVFQDNSLDVALTAQENLDFHCMMYHIPRGERKQRIKDVLALMELTEVKDRIVKTYSGGMRRRLEIARGLLHEPRLLILDEPTVGLDPQTRNYIWEYVHGLRERHHTAIFMTTHYMDEAENCDRIAVIDHGVIVALDTPVELKKLVGADQVELRTADNSRAITFIKDHYQVTASDREGIVTFEVPGADHFVPRLLADLSQAGISVDTMQVRRPTLEDVFLKLTGRTIRDDEGAKDERRLTVKRMGRI
jgi:ABC-2 type transport system ATP-binding protein